MLLILIHLQFFLSNHRNLDILVELFLYAVILVSLYKRQPTPKPEMSASIRLDEVPNPYTYYTYGQRVTGKVEWQQSSCAELLHIQFRGVVQTTEVESAYSVKVRLQVKNCNRCR